MESIRSLNYMVVVGFLLTSFTACTLPKADGNGDNLQVTPLKTIGPPSTTASNSPFPENESECKTKNPPLVEQQVDYHGIFPGQTTQQDILLVLGPPVDKIKLLNEEWFYDGYIIEFENNITKSIYVEGDGELLVTLEELIKRYGCPSLNFAIDRGQEPTGYYSALQLIYTDIGIEFFFYGYPINMADFPIAAEFFKPATLKDYLVESGLGFFHPNAGKPVAWCTAVRDCEP